MNESNQSATVNTEPRVHRRFSTDWITVGVSTFSRQHVQVRVGTTVCLHRLVMQ